jgi:glucose/arabinose dehydrogenase
MHGSWNRAARTGYKVVRLLFDASGKPTGEYEDFMTGFVVSNTQVCGRPVGVAEAKDGSLVVQQHHLAYHAPGIALMRVPWTRRCLISQSCPERG